MSFDLPAAATQSAVNSIARTPVPAPGFPTPYANHLPAIAIAPRSRSELTVAMAGADAAAAAAAAPAALPSLPPSTDAGSSPAIVSPRSELTEQAAPSAGGACEAPPPLPQAIPRPPKRRVRSALLSQSAPASKTLCAGLPATTHRAHPVASAPPSTPESVCSFPEAAAATRTARVALTDLPFSALVPGVPGRVSLECGTMMTSQGDNSQSSCIDLACDIPGAPGSALAAPSGELALKSHRMHASGGSDAATSSPAAADDQQQMLPDAWRHLLRTEPPKWVDACAAQSTTAACTCGGGCSMSAQLQRLPASNDAKDSLRAAFFSSLGFQPACASVGNALPCVGDFPPTAELATPPLALPQVEVPRQRQGAAAWRGAAAHLVSRSHSGALSALETALDSAAQFAGAGGTGRPKGSTDGAWPSEPRYSSDSVGVCLGSVQCGRPSSSASISRSSNSLRFGRPSMSALERSGAPMSSRVEGTQAGTQHSTQHSMQQATQPLPQLLHNMALPSFAPLACPARAVTPQAVRDTSVGLDTDEDLTGTWSEEEEAADKPGPGLGAIAAAVVRASANAAGAEEAGKGGGQSPEGSTGPGDSVSTDVSDAWANSFVPQASRAEVSDAQAAHAAPQPPQQRSSLDICLRRLRDQAEGHAGRPVSLPGANLLDHQDDPAPLDAARARELEALEARLQCGAAWQRLPPSVPESSVATSTPTPARSTCASEPCPSTGQAAAPAAATMGVVGSPPAALSRPLIGTPVLDAARLPLARDMRRRGKSIDISLLQRRMGDGGHPGPAAPRILCVDDNAVNQLVISRMLRSAGMHVDKAMSGAEALRKLQAAGDDLPDLLIMDVMMPGISGLELCRCAPPSHHCAFVAAIRRFAVWGPCVVAAACV